MCPDCNGNPVCETCGGDGHCSTCHNADGKCINCEGKGYIWVKPNSGGGGYSGDDDDDDDTGSGGSGNNQRRCNICNGYGDCRFWGHSYYDKFYCHGSGICQYCDGTGWQSSNVPCANCETPGRYGSPGNGKCSYCGGNGKCNTCGGSGYK